MTKWHQNQTARIVISILVILLAAFLVYKINHKKEAPIEEQKQNTIPTQAELNIPKTQSAIWEGILKISDDSKRGNLMLIAQERKIYIFTSRDFTNLLNKNVTVTYQGNLDNFVLGDINEKTN